MQFFKKAKSNFNILRINLVNIKITFSSEYYRKWAKNYLDHNFNMTNWDLKTIVHLSPFLFGFYQMIFYRYKDQVFSSFFETTLPGNKIIKETVSWETFEFIKSKNINVNKIKKVHLYNNFFLIEFIENNENYFVGYFSNPQTKEKIQINSNNYKLVLTDLLGFRETKNNNFLQQIYYNLDELPLKIEEINQSNSTKKSFFDFELDGLKNEKYLVKAKTKNLKNKKIISIPKFLQSDNIVFDNVIVGVTSKSEQFKNLTVEKINSYEKQKVLQKELDFLFYKNNLRPLIELKQSGQSLKQFTSNDSLNQEILKILNDYLPLQNNQFFLPRKISGYYYPDLISNDLYQIYINLLINQKQNNIALNVNLPRSFVFSVDDNFQSPCLLEKKLNLTNRKDGFFGFNLEQEFIEKKEKNDWQISLLKEINKKENINFQKLDDFDPDSWFLVFKTKEKTKTVNFEEQEVNGFLSTESKNNNLFYESILKNQIKNKKVNYHYDPFTENLVTDSFSKTSHFGEVYKRIPNFSIFLNQRKSSFQNLNFTFFDSREPISTYSWMIIIQFSVGLFLLRLLKDLYKDYGKELVDYVLHFASSSGIDVEEIKEQYLYDDPNYRLIKKVKKTFKNIAGIDNILPELGEVVWFLRNNGRLSKFKNSIPKGILLTGPPGTGKTLLVQAIAGEAEVPVIVESGSLLSDPQQKERGIEKLKKIFDQARQLSPCIIFIDEVDTIGEKRQNIIQTAMGGDELIESIYESKILDNESTLIPQPLNLDEDKNSEKDLEYELFRGESETQFSTGLGQFQKTIETKKTRLSLLTQFLVEMDGLKERQGVIVIGATNRPNVLDPALIRPGRFDKILNIELPGKTKRIEILKLYSKKLKIDKKISWDYLANRTQGFSAADLAAAMNESAIQSILNKTSHTIETIEHGIDLVTSYSSDNNYLNEKKYQTTDPFFISRLAYYQAGKAILQTLLPNHKPVVVLDLWPRQKNARHAKFYEKFVFGNKTRFELEIQLIGLYSGKAAETLTLYGQKTVNSLKTWHSDLGIEDLTSATFLANLMVDNWFLYSTRLPTRKFNRLLNNRNTKEFREGEKLELLSNLDNQVEDEIEIEQIAKLFRTSGYQQRGFGPWWQIQASKQISEIELFFADWYRIYLPDPEESPLNLEWLPPDEFYHTNESLKRISQKSDPSFNDLYKIERDYIYHGLILNAFNKAFSELENMREFLDYFADYLIRYNVLRQDQIFYILKVEKISNKFSIRSFPPDSELHQNNTDKNKQIITTTWGNYSRRPSLRFINFENLKFEKN